MPDKRLNRLLSVQDDIDSHNNNRVDPDQTATYQMLLKDQSDQGLLCCQGTFVSLVTP